MITLLGTSTVMQTLRDQIARIAPTPLPVLLQGETGTGKDLAAQAIHAASGRTGEFVTVDCAAISAGVLESELFGHTRGAFTGANHSREGLIAAADGGTFFLDEIGELPLDAQTRLLRLLENHTFRPVGAQQDRRVDIRVIAATWRGLHERVADRSFRQDLYHRISVVELTCPPLRDRRGDLDLLMAHFFARAAERHPRQPPELTPAAKRHLRRWPWPGNVRELNNVVDYLWAMTRGVVDMADLPKRLQRPLPEASHANTVPIHAELPYSEARRAWLDHFQERYVAAILHAHDGNVSAASRASGMDRRSIQRILKRVTSGPQVQ
ncbi:MAG: DNA-binding NtrC family response regulator [Myxococcota bacterium]|jgi:DNA-binding NtrC family response regulator